MRHLVFGIQQKRHVQQTHVQFLRVVLFAGLRISVNGQEQIARQIHVMETLMKLNAKKSRLVNGLKINAQSLVLLCLKKQTVGQKTSASGMSFRKHVVMIPVKPILLKEIANLVISASGISTNQHVLTIGVLIMILNKLARLAHSVYGVITTNARLTHVHFRKIL